MASPPFSIAETVPADADFVRNFPALERTFRDIVESWLTVHSDPASGYAKFPVDTTANLAALSPAQPIGSQRYDTTVNSLQIKVDASTWVNAGPAAGTVAIFLQETAPLGWTKITDAEIDQAILELSIGVDGGDYAGTTPIIDAVLTQAHLPSVNFTVTGTAAADGNHSHGGATGVQSVDHTHTFSGTTSSDGAHTHTTTFDNDSVGAGIPAFTDDGNTAAIFPETSSAGAHTHTVSGTTSGMSASHTHSIAASGTHTHTVTGNAASGGSATTYLSGVKRVIAIVCVKN